MKKELRAEALKQRDQMPLAEREEKSRQITAHILQSEAYQYAKRIFTFVSMGSEVETRGIMARAWKDGKIVAVPKTERGRVMYFLKIDSFADLTEGRFGVMEPLGGKEDAIVPEKGDLFLVPGALFDTKRNRMGYGGGYYDTYFEKYQGYGKIGLAFQSQVRVAPIPTEKTDIPLDDIVTENGWEEENMSNLVEMGKKAKAAAVVLATLSTPRKNKALLASADALLAAQAEILAANKADVDAALENGIKGAFIDRLTLTEARLADMADGLRQVAKLDDPVGEVLSMKTLDNGLVVGQKRVPMGVIGIIFEARPNVTADAFGLCLKAGSAVILRGGKEAFRTNQATIKALRSALAAEGLPEDCVQMVPDTSRETANEMMRLNGYLDVLIPRGGAGLINSVVQNSTVPVIQTGVGNCHVYVDESADFEKAAKIVINAKTQRPGVCNACESLLVHEKIAEAFLPEIGKALQQKKVEIRGDEATQKLVDGSVAATEEDWGTEYADYIISARVVKDINEAIDHIRKYSTGHSEAIVTENYTNAQRFLNEVDAAAVYVNASTRFTDGGQFGFGAEIGISTQKLHARGPMGLKELTTTKYIIYGDGQIRE